MSEMPDLLPEAPAPMAVAPATIIGSDWNALPAQAAQVAMIGGLAFGLLLGLAGVASTAWPLVNAWGALSWWQAMLVLFLFWLMFGAAGVWIAYRRWQFSAWKLDETGLHVRRGRAWRKEILIPRSRVQHLDIERGPLERHHGLATLIVHTAGTRRHALRQSGLADADAVALRDALVPTSDRHDDVL